MGMAPLERGYLELDSDHAKIALHELVHELVVEGRSAQRLNK